MPDLIIIWKGRVYALELKTERGRLSDDQVRVHAEMRAAGCEVGVTYGLGEALHWLERRGILRGQGCEYFAPQIAAARDEATG